MILAIIGTILSFIGVLGLFFYLILQSENKRLLNIFEGTAIAGVIFILIGTIVSSYNPNPQPIEVYQGKTTLQITYEDSIPVDSVVVYKPEFRK